MGDVLALLLVAALVTAGSAALIRIQAARRKRIEEHKQAAARAVAADLAATEHYISQVNNASSAADLDRLESEREK
jgi:hypothetical protein